MRISLGLQLVLYCAIQHELKPQLFQHLDLAPTGQSHPAQILYMDQAAKVKRKRDLMHLRDAKEKMRTVLFQIASLERSKSDLKVSSVSP